MKSESRNQQDARLIAAYRGDALWRNNVGATPSKEPHTCPKCSFKFTVSKTPIRYGLANDSTKVNRSVKSADLIGITRRLIGPEHVGRYIGQFTSVEIKPEGWAYKGTPREIAQLAWLELVNSLGGHASFYAGETNG